MRRMMAAAALAAGLIGLAGCGRSGNSNQLTAEENAQLDDAGNMLDASPDSLAVTNAPIGNGEDQADDEADDNDAADEDANAA